MRHLRFILTGAAVLLLAMPGALLAQDKVLEYDGVLGARDCHTENCSTWHELFPSFCGTSHQDSWEDNGDGCLSPCDYITLSGERFHVDWVGPTYWLDCDLILEPIDPSGGDPVCQEWIEVWPNYGNLWHIADWVDNGDGEPGVCDIIVVVGGDGTTLQCHISEVGLNIHVTGDPTATEDTSWGKVKRFFTPPF